MTIEALDYQSETVEFNNRYLIMAFSDVRLRHEKYLANAGIPAEDSDEHPFIGQKVLMALTSMFESVEPELVSAQIPPQQAIDYCFEKLDDQVRPKGVTLPDFSESSESLRRLCYLYCDEYDIPHSLGLDIDFDSFKFSQYLLALPQKS